MIFCQMKCETKKCRNFRLFGKNPQLIHIPLRTKSTVVDVDGDDGSQVREKKKMLFSKLYFRLLLLPIQENWQSPLFTIPVHHLSVDAMVGIVAMVVMVAIPTIFCHRHTFSTHKIAQTEHIYYMYKLIPT